MTQYEFTVILQGSPDLTEEMADALFAAGCDDGTPGSCHGVFSIDFHREANSLEEAIRSAMADIRMAGFQTARVEMAAEAMLEHA